MPRSGGTISLAPNAGAIAHHSNAERIWHGCGSSNPGSLVRLAFHSRTSFPVRSATSWKTRFTLSGTPGRTCTLNFRVRSAVLWLLNYGSMKWCPWQDSHPHWTASEAVVSAVGLHGHKTGNPGWICTINSALQRRVLC